MLLILFLVLSHLVLGLGLTISVDDDYDFYDFLGLEKNDGKTTSSEWKTDLEKKVLPLAKTPPFEEGKRLPVQLMFSTIDHVYLDDQEQMLRVTGRICLVWNDQRILWDPDDNDQTTVLHVASDDIWIPKFKASSNMYDRNSWKNQKDLVHISVHENAWVYLVTCPKFAVKTGCALDMSRYPHDQHVCSFMITVEQWQNVDLQVSDHSDSEISKLRYAITRNDTRQTIGDFTVLSINSTTKWSDGYKLFETHELDKPMIPIALQIVVFQRQTNRFFVAYEIPALSFVCLNVAAALSRSTKFALSLYILNICAIGAFLRNVADKFPRYFTRTPDFVLHISISLCLAITSFFYISTREIVFLNLGWPSTLEKFPATSDIDKWKDVLLKKILSFDFLVILISFLTTFWYFL